MSNNDVHHNAPPDLADSFRRYFRLLPALNEELRQDTYRIRHEVYCQDLGWEPQRENAMESDGFDAHSTACLMKGSQDDKLVGCLRLVHCPDNDPSQALPVERACAATLNPTLFDIAALDRRKIAEVSRLAVMRDFRRRKGEQDKPVVLEQTDFGLEGQQRFPFIPVGLYLAAFAMADCLGIDHLLVLTEPRLARHLAKLGIDIRDIGGPIEHRGMRVPSVIQTQTTIKNLHPRVTRMWRDIHSSFAALLAQQATAVPAKAA